MGDGEGAAQLTIPGAGRAPIVGTLGVGAFHWVEAAVPHDIEAAQAAELLGLSPA